MLRQPDQMGMSSVLNSCGPPDGLAARIGLDSAHGQWNQYVTESLVLYAQWN